MANAPDQHAILNPSGASRWMNCHASVILSLGIPRRESHYAQEGTAAHELAALTLQDTAHNCEAYLGRVMSNGWEVDEDMCRDVQVYVDNVLFKAEGNLLLVEQALPIGHLTGEPDAEGTGDAVIIAEDGDLLCVDDLKFGRGVAVKAERNKQLMLYGLGALEKYDMMCSPSRVQLTIHQPRIDGRPSCWEVTVDELLAFAEEVKEVRALFDITIDADGKKHVKAKRKLEANPGTEQCRWCEAAGVCPAIAKKVRVAIIGEDELDDLCGDEAPAEVVEATEQLKVLPNDRLGALMGISDLVETWLKAVRSSVETRLLRGEQVDGYKLIQGRMGNRAWSDKDVVEDVLKSMRLNTTEMYNLKLISPTEAERLLKKDSPRRWKKLQEHVTRSEGKPSVAEESHSSPALVLASVADDIDALTSDDGDLA